MHCKIAPTALTGPLHQFDDPAACDTSIDSIPHFRTEVQGRMGREVMSRRWMFVREITVLRLLYKRIMRLLDRSSFHIIHAHSPALCGLAAAQAAAARGIPFVYEIRAFWEDAAVDQNKLDRLSPRYRMMRQLETYVARRAHAVIGIADCILRDLEQRGIPSRRLFHVPNGVDTIRFSPSPEDAELRAGLQLGAGPVLGFIGSLYRYEGVAWLVQAAAELRRRGVAVNLLIVGDGEDLHAVKQTIRECQAQSYVYVLGRIPHDQIQRYYSVMDVLVYPRRRVRLTEIVTPLKPLEAMSLAKPVLASDLAAIRELIEPGINGLLFAPEDLDDFCHKAEQLLKDRNLRFSLGGQARRTMLETKDWRALARRYRLAYDAAMHHCGKQPLSFEDGSEHLWSSSNRACPAA
jgi:PEP-CTERM/exosortase A-associated glycosyltransferase